MFVNIAHDKLQACPISLSLIDKNSWVKKEVVRSDLGIPVEPAATATVTAWRRTLAYQIKRVILVSINVWWWSARGLWQYGGNFFDKFWISFGTPLQNMPHGGKTSAKVFWRKNILRLPSELKDNNDWESHCIMFKLSIVTLSIQLEIIRKLS